MMMTMVMTVMTMMVAVLVMELWPTAKSIQLHGATIRPMTNNEWPSSAGWAQREQFQTSLNLRSRPTQARQGGEDHHHHHNYDYMTPSMPGLKIISIVQRQPASEVDRTKPTKATKCLNVLLQVLIWYLIWSCSHLMAHCNLKSLGSSSSPAKGARIAKPVARQPVVPNSPR